VKFVSDRSASANVVGSSTATCAPAERAGHDKRRAAGIDCGWAARSGYGEQPIAALKIDDIAADAAEINRADHAAADHIGDGGNPAGDDINAAVGHAGIDDSGVAGRRGK